MKRNSNIAKRFVAVAHFKEAPNSQEDVGTMRMETVVFEPDATIEQVFAAFWPEQEKPDDAVEMYRSMSYKAPFRIELMPDEKTIPPEEKLFQS